MFERNKKTGFPSLITLFSAPNYASHYNNKGAIMCYENNAMTIKQFTDSPSPYNLPSFANVFAWSLPFVATKIGELLLAFYNLINDEQIEESENEKLEIKQKLKQRLFAVSRMMLILTKLKKKEKKN